MYLLYWFPQQRILRIRWDTSYPVADVSNNEVMSGISEKTFQSWLKTLDPNGIWIRGKIFDKSAVRIQCALHAKHRERLRCFHNFTSSATPSSTALLALLSNVMHCQRIWRLQLTFAGYINTVIYSCLATTVKTFFFIFSHSKRWESNESMKQTFSVVDVYSQKIQYSKMQF